MPTPIATTAKTTDWLNQHVRPVIASLAGQGRIGALESLELLQGLDGLTDLVEFVKLKGPAIKRAVEEGRL